MTELQTEQSLNFHAFLEKLYGQFEPSDILHKLRMKAWDHFLELGLPSRSNEVYRSIKLRLLYAHDYQASILSEVSEDSVKTHILPECSQSVLVFVNGHYVPALSRTEGLPKRMVISTTAEAMRTYSGFLNSQWAKALKEETDPFAAVNRALHRDGLFLYLPPKTVVETPIQILNIVDSQATPMFIMPRIQGFVGAQSQVAVISTQAVLSGTNYGINMLVDMAVEEDAHVQYTQIATDCSDGIWQFEALRATLKRNSTLKTIAVTDGAATVRNDYHVILAGENSEVQLNGVWMLKGKKEAHVNILIDHQAPNCRSMQLFKGVLNDTSRSSFDGKIIVRQLAQKTEAFQLNNNLLLSDHANADSKPNLEIFADDVKASHGATVGQLDKEQIFYMKTRGFSDAQAKNLLVFGFCEQVINLIKVASAYQSMRQLAQEYLVCDRQD